MTNAVESTVVGRGTPSPAKTATRGTVVYGRYYGLHAKIGMGGMASVYLGWLSGDADFSRVVAIKRLHPQYALDEHFASRFRDEARLSARLCHPNIVQVFDVVERNRELLIIMEYVHGVSLSNLVRDAQLEGLKIPPSVIAGVMVPALQGLHAAHDATDDEGNPIGIVHRDFSPQNIMVSGEGHSKILDFGVARARTHLHVTMAGKFSGKLGYCSPEQVGGGQMDRRTDVFAAGIVLWEMLTGERLFYAPGIADGETIGRIVTLPLRPPSSLNPHVPTRLDEIVLRALERKPENRFASARELACELEAAIDMASPSAIAECVDRACAKRMAKLTRILNGTRRRMAQAKLGLAGPGAMPVEQAPSADSLNNTEPLAPAEVAVQPIPSTRGRWGKLAVAAALVLVLSALVYRNTRSQPARDVAPVPAVSAAVPVRHGPEVSPVPELPKAVAEPPSPALPSEASPAPEVAAPKRRVGHTRKAQHAMAKPRAPQKTNAGGAPQRPDCNPPTYLDADGIRVFKDGCL
jgi:eukaryotic-like serine/threonine-protein kinase